MFQSNTSKNMADILVESGRIIKMEVDYSSTCDEKIPECEKLAKSGQLNEAIEALLSLEKQTRTVDFYLKLTLRFLHLIFHSRGQIWCPQAGF